MQDETLYRRSETSRLPPAPRRRTSAEESLAAHNREYHNRPLCPELERADSEPIVGVCPACGLASGSLRIGAQTWHYCDEHKVCWHTSNGRSGAHDVGEWKANAKQLAAYEIVCPRRCVRADGTPSLVQLNMSLRDGQKRDREKRRTADSR